MDVHWKTYWIEWQQLRFKGCCKLGAGDNGLIKSNFQALGDL